MTSPRSLSARSKARRRALEVLYEADIRGDDPLDVLRRRVARAEPPIPDYACELVEGAVSELSELDALIAAYAEGWTLDRMPPVDRNILRLSAYELRHRPEIDTAVIINEAVELAKSLSTDDSPRFINGILARLAPGRSSGADW